MTFANLNRVTERTVVFVLMIFWLTGSQAAQKANEGKTNEEKVQELTKLINSRYTFEDLINGNPEAIAIDEQVFSLTSDLKVKRRIAGILVSIRVKDRVYFDYLVSEAKKALDNDMPWPTLYDEHGKVNQNTLMPATIEWFKKHGEDAGEERYASYKSANPEFLDWCIEHHQNPNEARFAAYYVIPDPWSDLAAAHDPRAYDLLVQGLHSHNLMIADAAARGLARLQDPRAIDELIATGRRAPGEARVGIVTALLYFSDPKAQAAAEEFSDVFADRRSLGFLREKAKRDGVKGLFSY